MSPKLQPRAVTRAEWLIARKALLAEEKALTRQRDALAKKRQALPWVKLDKDYVFDTPHGRQTLADLFAGKSQLLTYHFMFAPGWAEGCPSCSLVADSTAGIVDHLAARDVTFVAVSRATLPEIEAFRQRMGWRFAWVSSHGNDFNRDFQVSFTQEELAANKVPYNYEVQALPVPIEEMPGISVFYRDGDAVYHTYSSYGRGGEPWLGVYNYLDLVPKGRDEEGLPWPMAWVRHHDRYRAAQP